MGLRFNPPPGWPPVPPDFLPGVDWQPDPSWPPAPEGWQLLVEDPTTAPLETPPELQDAFRVTSGYDPFAIASLACSILGGVLLGIGFGIVALRRIRRSRAMGRGMAIAGISISTALLGVATVVIGIGLTRGWHPLDETASPRPAMVW